MFRRSRLKNPKRRCPLHSDIFLLEQTNYSSAVERLASPDGGPVVMETHGATMDYQDRFLCSQPIEKSQTL